ncbi:hypothetical protein CEN48_09250 [Fischerella thermalis CCMEE 5282]|nr:hypothetical protein CBP19_01015 [Fischerella thermalis WC1110]PLZ41093.1 hypothetical protein CBP25_18205 [Fischerella thermalis WC527]PLZ42670.1 hypothetical protein CBP26_06905 [Fischerella thermalis WC538]PLZ49184.1 hypothetical protein CBP13_18210 [Fischerella thermalis WC441]PLZ68113.1 hypothetical protein CBP23_02185 [Fischerella thermalis WC344]PMB14693.1 hypothetical protein CEN48_09250 [Fischerella thermalis CCMEE 5282]PMB32458.1 hypothetical protein CEN42_13610 [Fischerella ther
MIFANNKSQTEAVIASLRKVAMREGEADIYHVHHGSISASLRQVFGYGRTKTTSGFVVNHTCLENAK